MNFKLVCFPFHKWGKWEEYAHGNIMATSLYNSKISHIVAQYISQKRTCTVCDKIELRRIRTDDLG